MKNFLISAFLFLSMHGFSQTAISGHIKDNKGKPIPGVSITLKDTYDGTVTDSLGNFSFTTKETGSHIIEISNVNYDDYQTSG